MSEQPVVAVNEAAVFRRLTKALRTVCLSLPHFTGLAHAVRLQFERRVPTMGVFASGRLVVNPDFAATLSDADLVFILAHELYHLALRTHARAVGVDARLFNVAHDYIINDLLCEELGGCVPAGGLEWPGARHFSAEHLVTQLVRSGWRCPEMYDAAGNLIDDPASAPDVLTAEVEREWFPNESASAQNAATSAMHRLIDQALLNELIMENARLGMRGNEAGHMAAVVDALRGSYRPPWEAALQRWVEAVVPATRTYHRASRRGGARRDVVLPGRKREGWILHLVLDTSGSMASLHARILGVIADYCEAASVEHVHLLQCDTQVTRDELLSPEQLARFQITGLGGSDLTPALLRLADDAEVEAAVVLTDGDILYPPEPMPYTVLWVVPTAYASSFRPPYGTILELPPLAEGLNR